jgi:hypothetical protein
MKVKLISIGILFVVVMAFIVFVFNINNTPVEHGRTIYTSTVHSVECSGWEIGPWGNSKCENVYINSTRYEDGHLAVNETRTEVQ